jgi:putative transposase
MSYAAIHTLRATHSIRTLCRVLAIAPSSYHAWCARARAGGAPGDTVAPGDTALVEALTAAYRAGRGTYGRPRLTRELKAQGLAIGERRVAQWQRRLGLWGKRRGARARGYRTETPRAPAPNRLARAFHIGRPNERWASDTTWLPTREGALALAVVLDVGSRRVVGWATSATLDSQLTRRALAMALARRPLGLGGGLLHHADLGSEYVAERYCAALEAEGVTLSFSRPRNCWDNAVVESFFASLKAEGVPETPGGFATHATASTHLFDYIEVFYNRVRRHSTLSFMSPADYEAQHSA